MNEECIGALATVLPSWLAPQENFGANYTANPQTREETHSYWLSAGDDVI